MTIAISLLLTLSLTASFTLGQVYFPPGYEVPTYAFINVAPNPIGVGQTVNVNFFLASPIETSEGAANMTVEITDPDGHSNTYGPYTSDATGGTFFNFVPDKAGEWEFQFFYGGQWTTGRNSESSRPGFGDLYELPSESEVYTLVVEEEPIYELAYPITPLPTQWWQTPVTAENVQEWYKITGDWLGLGSITFASTGAYNATSYCNPYTDPVLSGHVLWTKEWCAGGVVGGEGGGTEDAGHYWSTRQYQPQYAPVIINGRMYSTWYPETTRFPQGIVCTDLYTGQTLWTINTTNALRCGMVTRYHQINQYGVIGPFIWTTGTLPAADTGGVEIPNRGTQWNMYSGLTGKYFLSIVNGTTPTRLMEDENGNLIGYYLNSTAGTETVYPLDGSRFGEQVTSTGPHLTCWNMTRAIGQTGGSWQPRINTIRDFATGIMWTKPVPTEINGLPISPSLALSSITGNTLVLTGGFLHGQGVGSEVPGWFVIAGMDLNTGDILMAKNLTYPEAASYLPFTRTSQGYGDGLFVNTNLVNFQTEAYDVRTGNRVWEYQLKTPYADGTPDIYNNFGISTRFANGVIYFYGLGGDIWALESKTGELLWYTNTTTLIGDPGIETPYDIWPLWVFSCTGFTKDVADLNIGHEYNPPLFHGSQILAINATNGELIWSELGMYIRSTAIAYNIMLSMNAYDNQIYAFGKGPSAVTVTAPDVGVTTETPITIRGTVMDVSPGTLYLTNPDETMTKQNEVALRFPNGVPCVSDESQSHWMEYVYQQQLKPTDVIGVPVTISVVDSNNNERVIGTTISRADGTFSFTWTPDISGGFYVTATFEGSNSYFPSSGGTSFYASDAPQATPEPTPQPASVADLYFVPATIGIIIAIVIVGLVLFLLLRKR